jgi:isopentenyl-diphosphate delta-isomerase
MLNPEEALSVVNEQDQPLRTLPRKEVHQKMLLHRISHIWIINEHGQILSQKRSGQKDKWPGMWECWFGGHVLADQTYLETAIQETKEELGLDVTAADLLAFGKKRVTNGQENTFITIYAFKRPLDIAAMQLEADEVELVQWFSVAELTKIYTDQTADWVRYGYELEVLTWLSKIFNLSR